VGSQSNTSFRILASKVFFYLQWRRGTSLNFNFLRDEPTVACRKPFELIKQIKRERSNEEGEVHKQREPKLGKRMTWWLSLSCKSSSGTSLFVTRPSPSSRCKTHHTALSAHVGRRCKVREGGRVKECLVKEHVECKGGNGEEGREVWSPEIEERMYVKQCVRKR